MTVQGAGWQRKGGRGQARRAGRRGRSRGAGQPPRAL